MFTFGKQRTQVVDALVKTFCHTAEHQFGWLAGVGWLAGQIGWSAGFLPDGWFVKLVGW
jgi:hypothetical protein